MIGQINDFGLFITLCAILGVSAYVLLVCGGFVNLKGSIPFDPSKLRKAREAFPTLRKADEASLYDIVHTKLPPYMDRKIDFEPEDHGPQGKWVGYIGGHRIVVLCYQTAFHEPPNWVIMESFRHDNLICKINVQIVVERLTPDQFSQQYPLLEQELIQRAQDHWLPSGI